MINDLGYKKNLFVLPFDHKSSFAELFGFTNPELSPEEKEAIVNAKEIIYTAFKNTIGQEIPKDQAAISVDEEYGDKIIRDAISQKYNVFLATEKDRQKEFSFEYEDDFAKHIEKYKSVSVKVLTRYNPNDDPLSKMRQQQKLQILSNYCHEKSIKFLLEIVVSPTSSQIDDSNEDNSYYNTQVRPNLTVEAMEELQGADIEPDVWAIEGMENEDSYKIVSLQARKEERNSVGIVILGRSKNEQQIEKMIRPGSKIKGIIGFAIGGTVFWGPLVDYKNGKIEKEKAIELIGNNFLNFYHIFTNKA